jgi:hypothetical protein
VCLIYVSVPSGQKYTRFVGNWRYNIVRSFYVREVFRFSYPKGRIIFNVPEKMLLKIFRYRGEKEVGGGGRRRGKEEGKAERKGEGGGGRRRQKLKDERLKCFLSETGNRCKNIKENEPNRKWKGHIGNTNKIVVEKPDGKRPFRRSTHKREKSTKMILMETVYQRIE